MPHRGDAVVDRGHVTHHATADHAAIRPRSSRRHRRSDPETTAPDATVTPSITTESLHGRPGLDDNPDADDRPRHRSGRVDPRIGRQRPSSTPRAPSIRSRLAWRYAVGRPGVDPVHITVPPRTGCGRRRAAGNVSRSTDTLRPDGNPIEDRRLHHVCAGVDQVDGLRAGSRLLDELEHPSVGCRLLRRRTCDGSSTAMRCSVASAPSSPMPLDQPARSRGRSARRR